MSQPFPPDAGQPQPPYQQQQPYPQLPAQPPFYPPVQPPPKKRGFLRSPLGIGCGVLAALVVLIIVIIAIASAASSGSTANNPTPTGQSTTVVSQQNTPAAKPTSKPAPTFATFGDGTFQVGKDIQPGTYRTRTGSSNCYYERLKGFSGSTDDILANNNTDAPAIVTIKSTDKGFTSQNCGTWTKDLSQITTSKTSFGDGILIVKTDITPGTYKDTGGSNCYYARLSGFGNTTDDILANNNVSAPSIVTIAASDKGFQSNGCGTWSKV